MKQILVALILLIGCSQDETPVAPPMTPPPPPTLTGTWDLTLTGTALPSLATMTMNHSDTLVAGTIDWPKFNTRIVLSGSCSAIGSVRMSATDGFLTYRLLTTANAGRTEMSGRLEIDSATIYRGYYTADGRKR
jgi:hypothetical protein